MTRLFVEQPLASTGSVNNNIHKFTCFNINKSTHIKSFIWSYLWCSQKLFYPAYPLLPHCALPSILASAITSLNCTTYKCAMQQYCTELHINNNPRSGNCWTNKTVGIHFLYLIHLKSLEIKLTVSTRHSKPIIEEVKIFESGKQSKHWTRG